ncbi:MAG: ABC transporter permease [Streptococcaceae bacterium]|jgi:ABC-2 type transport system permease protein|nr:ABC transporter permease [Streptococcaceae bacterium]
MKPLTKTFGMFRALLKRDWVRLSVWVIMVLLFVGSGVTKFSAIFEVNGKSSPAQQATIYNLFAGNPAMVALFGPTPVKNAAAYTIGAVFGQTMTLITALVFIIVTIVYVANRTRRDEDEGIAELFRSFQVGKLANTTAVVLIMALLQVVTTLLLAVILQKVQMESMTSFSSNLLYASGLGAQTFMWAMITLLVAQIMPDAGSVKGASMGILGTLYVIRMYTDTQNISLSWLNPLSWSYLTDVYVKDNWTPIVLALALSFIILALSYSLELRRDVAVSYIPESRGKEHASALLQSLTGLTLRMQRTAFLGWAGGLFILGIVYGSMINGIGDLIKGNSQLAQMFALDPKAGIAAMTAQYLTTVFMVMGIITTCYGITSLTRMASEERKNRQEQLYAGPLSRLKLYATYTLVAWSLSAIVQFITVLGLWIAQSGNSSAVEFGKMMTSGMVWVFPMFFVLSIVSLLIAFLPRFTAVIWVYVGFSFFMGYLGNMLKFPQALKDLNVFAHVFKETSQTVAANTPNWNNLWLILALAVVLTIIGFVGYRRRDLISA